MGLQVEFRLTYTPKYLPSPYYLKLIASTIDIPPSLESQVSGLNIIRHAVQGDMGLVPTWQQKLKLNDKEAVEFFFQSCAKAAATSNGVEKEKNANEGESVIARRVGTLARRVCKMAGTTHVWDAFLNGKILII